MKNFTNNAEYVEPYFAAKANLDDIFNRKKLRDFFSTEFKDLSKQLNTVREILTAKIAENSSIKSLVDELIQSLPEITPQEAIKGSLRDTEVGKAFGILLDFNPTLSDPDCNEFFKSIRGIIEENTGLLNSYQYLFFHPKKNKFLDKGVTCETLETLSVRFFEIATEGTGTIFDDYEFHSLILFKDVVKYILTEDSSMNDISQTLVQMTRNQILSEIERRLLEIANPALKLRKSVFGLITGHSLLSQYTSEDIYQDFIGTRYVGWNSQMKYLPRQAREQVVEMLVEKLEATGELTQREKDYLDSLNSIEVDIIQGQYLDYVFSGNVFQSDSVTSLPSEVRELMGHNLVNVLSYYAPGSFERRCAISELKAYLNN